MIKRRIINPAFNRMTCSAGISIIMVLLILLTGCASTQTVEGDAVSAKRKAAESNTSLGLEYMNRGQYEVALGKLKKALRSDPEYAPAHTVTAVLYERLGEDSLAGKHYEKAFEADPSNGDVNNNIGVYLCKKGNDAKAMEHFRRALDDPFYGSPAVAMTNAGACAMISGDAVMADDYLRRALKTDPNFPDALITMAKLNFQEGNYLKSRAFLQRYESVAEHEAESLLLAYKVEMASSDPRSAYKYKLLLETNFSDTPQAQEVRRFSEK